MEQNRQGSQEGRGLETVKFKISTRACVDILTTAFETGSGYWISEYGPSANRNSGRYVQSLALRNVAGMGEFDVRAKRSIILPSNIAVAIGDLITDQDVHGRILGEILGNLERDGSGCGADAEACDCVLQKAIFRKVVYG